jgi:uncharacterized protein involved in exopolysaccharide biosynthesis
VDDSTYENGIDFRQLFARLYAEKWRILAPSLMAAAIAGAIGFMMTPVYRATTVLVSAMPDRSGLSSALGSALGSLNSLASFAGVNVGGADAEIEEALAVLRSRQFTESFIRDLELLPILYADDWDGAAKKWKTGPDDQPTMGKAYRFFHKKIRGVSRDKKTGLVTLTIDWSDPQLAADWANELVRRLNSEMRSRAISQSDASLQYLNAELARTQTIDTRAAINRLIESQIRQRMIASVTPEFAFRVVDAAIKPEVWDKVRPNRAIMILFGGILGALAGVLWVYFRTPVPSESKGG